MSLEFPAFIDSLSQIDWFASVGRSLPGEGATQVTSWSEAFNWTENPISWWCNVEGKKVLYEILASEHYKRFVEWNDIAREILPKIRDLVEQKVVSRVPGVVFPEKARNWIQSQLLSATMESAYADCVNVCLFRRQVDLYVKGHFPCGWHVAAPDEFPQNASLKVF